MLTKFRELCVSLLLTFLASLEATYRSDPKLNKINIPKQKITIFIYIHFCRGIYTLLYHFIWCYFSLFFDFQLIYHKRDPQQRSTKHLRGPLRNKLKHRPILAQSPDPTPKCVALPKKDRPVLWGGRKMFHACFLTPVFYGCSLSFCQIHQLLGRHGVNRHKSHVGHSWAGRRQGHGAVGMSEPNRNTTGQFGIGSTAAFLARFVWVSGSNIFKQQKTLDHFGSQKTERKTSKNDSEDHTFCSQLHLLPAGSRADLEHNVLPTLWVHFFQGPVAVPTCDHSNIKPWH